MASHAQTSATVQPLSGSPTAYKLINPTMKALLKSPLHGIMSKGLMVLCFMGRKSGKQYEIPVAYHRLDDDPNLITVVTHSRWGVNFDDGRQANLLIRGEWHSLQGQAIRDTEEVAEAIHHLLEKNGKNFARMLGLKISSEGVPSLDEVRAGVHQSRIIKFQM
jgi:hypothetical protein